MQEVPGVCVKVVTLPAVLAGGLATVMLFAVPAYPWERDVHEGLTQWLAIQAGFSPDDARIIANGDEIVDDDPDTDPVWTEFKALLFNDQNDAENVQVHHFPSEGKLRSEPARRRVEPHSPPSRKSLDAQIEMGCKGRSLETALDELGKALHPFQDSWSHQGQPDTPLRPWPIINSDIAWSHPESRHGWSSHDADLTYLFPEIKENAVKMAEATFNALATFREKNPCAPKAGFDPTTWKSIEAQAGKFAEGRTRAEKREWFTKVGRFKDGEAEHFTWDINLPAPDEDLTQRTRFRSKRRASAPPPEKPAPPEFQSAADSFLKTWIIEKDPARALEVHVNLEQLQAQFVLLEFQAKDTTEWLSKFLTSWLTADHGLVNLRGHVLPSHPGYKTLPVTPSQADIMSDPGSKARFKTFTYRSLDDAIQAFWSEGPYDISEMPKKDGPQTYAVTFRFRHTRRDGIALIFSPYGKDAESSARNWRITRVLWAVGP